MCVNSSIVNTITIKHRFPIVRLEGLLDSLYAVTIFSLRLVIVLDIIEPDI